MANATWTDGRESGTGQDTPKVCVLSRPASTLRRAGHAGTLSRPVPLSVRLTLASEFAKLVV
jgi:hypothetical protein